VLNSLLGVVAQHQLLPHPFAIEGDHGGFHILLPPLLGACAKGSASAPTFCLRSSQFWRNLPPGGGGGGGANPGATHTGSLLNLLPTSVEFRRNLRGGFCLNRPTTADEAVNAL
jgi:hypothetical protein